MRQGGEQGEGHQRAQQGAGRVQRAVDAEGQAEPFGRRAQRDQRIARRGADALADAVDRDGGGRQAPRPAGRQQADLADGRHPVAQDGDVAVAAPAIAHQAAGQARRRGDALRQAVDEAELQRRHAHGEDEPDRQDRRHHLGGDVRQQAGQAEEPDVGRDARHACESHFLQAFRVELIHAAVNVGGAGCDWLRLCTGGPPRLLSASKARLPQNGEGAVPGGVWDCFSLLPWP